MIATTSLNDGVERNTWPDFYCSLQMKMSHWARFDAHAPPNIPDLVY